MKTNSTGHVDDEQRTPWEPPAVKKIAIGAEFEMAIPMSARIDNKS